MTIREWLAENASKYPTKSAAREACVAELGVTEKTFNDKCTRHGYYRRASSATIPTDNGLGLIGVTEGEYAADFDWVGKLREGLKLIKPNTDTALVPDATLRRYLKVPDEHWRKLKRRPEFLAYQITINGKKLHWCQPETKQRMLSKHSLRVEEPRG